jgi:outer membrane immunogenic protein
MNFKNKKLVSITFTCFLPTLVCAADISNSIPWAGFYAGVNAGYAWDKSNIGVVGNMATLVSGASTSNRDDSALGGIQIGYNIPVGSSILGIETDLNYLDLENSKTQTADYGYANDRFHTTSNVDWFGTVRARAGISPTEKLLLFATGGLAYGEVKSRSQFNAYYPATPAHDSAASNSISDTEFGWTAGAGIEYAFMTNISAKVEYSYVDLGTKKYNVNGSYFNGDPIAYNVTDESKFSFLRFGLNYKF